jgi:predicted nucleotidyltransferase
MGMSDLSNGNREAILATAGWSAASNVRVFGSVAR